ncbi:MAG: hypothetical protein ACLQVI_21600, partial [Polyangiaceae bacterium]
MSAGAFDFLTRPNSCTTSTTGRAVSTHQFGPVPGRVRYAHRSLGSPRWVDERVGLSFDAPEVWPTVLTSG